MDMTHITNPLPSWATRARDQSEARDTAKSWPGWSPAVASDLDRRGIRSFTGGRGVKCLEHICMECRKVLESACLLPAEHESLRGLILCSVGSRAHGF